MKYDEASMLAAIRRVMAENDGQPVTSRVYEAQFKRGSEPSPKLISTHFGSWAAAVQRAQAERLGAAYDAVRVATNDTIATARTEPPPAPVRLWNGVSQHEVFVGAMGADTPRPANDTPSFLPQSRSAFVVGDIHFGAEHVGFWPAFKAMVRHRRPHTLIFNGDIIDAEVLSQYPKRSDTPPHVVDEIRRAIAEINELASHVVECIVIPGNHDLRWEAAVGGAYAMALKGAVGLSLREQFYAQGLDPRVRWVQEQNGVPGFRYAETRVRHGHNQAKRGGGFGAKHLAAKYLAEEWVSTATNHHHTAQMVCRTVVDIDERVRTVQAMTIPCATRPHDYWMHPNWQWGCGVIESFAPDYRRSSNYVVVADPETGTFSYGGTTYLGNAKPIARAA